MLQLHLEPGGPPCTAERAVDAELDAFDDYFRSIQRDHIGLTGPERAAIKTFCAYLMGIGPHNPRARSTSTEITDDATKNSR